MTKRDFEAAVKRMSMSERGMEMARRVLVGGEQQQRVAADFEVTDGAVSQHVSKVWRTFVNMQEIPAGFERITAVLPSDKAEIVRTWERDYSRRTR